SHIPDEKPCGPGFSPVLVLQNNATTVGRRLRIIPESSLRECNHCAQRKNCIGVEFLNSKCMLYGKYGRRAATFGSIVLSKYCVKKDKVCASTFHFEALEKKLLVGFDLKSVPANKVQECLVVCLNAPDKLGFECESLMFYQTKKKCVLNSEDRFDRPHLFVDGHDEDVIYMDTNCAGSECRAPLTTKYIAEERRVLNNVQGMAIKVDSLEKCQSFCDESLSTSVCFFS
ncbi:hypothetical protein PENTCL1PPCAC_23718, partial [Pristionchus entomophagus]